MRRLLLPESVVGLVVACLAFSCTPSPPSTTLERVARGTEHMISAPTPEAVQAGLEVLEAGGNAVDAAVATAFALHVTDPQMGSVGGRSQILIRLADGSFHGIDGATQAPLRVDEPWRQGQGYGVVPIPGSPAALEQMLEEFGTMAFSEVLQPAIRLATDGFTIKRDLHEAFRANLESFQRYPGTRAHFLKADGNPYSEGDLFRQPALARTLEAMAEEGADALYTGSLADAFVRDMEENGGLVRHDDLAQYEPQDGEIVRGSYRGYPIVARGGNCDGASVIEMLQILEHFDLTAYDIADPEYINLVAQTLFLGNADEYLSDQVQVSDEHASRRVEDIDLKRALPGPARDAAAAAGDTHHFSVVDAAGNAVAMTQSMGPGFGSKVASPELGFFYAYSYDMNDDPVPFQREKTSQSPSMLLANDGLFLALGSAGSSRIPGSIVRTVVNLLDHGMSMAEALAARRWFIANDQLRIEASGLSDATLRALEGYGYRLSLYEGMDGYFARVHAIMVDPDSGTLVGGSDPRDYGASGGR